MSCLFDKHEVPILADMTADEAWAACEAFDSYVYDVGEDVSEDEWDYLRRKVDALYDEYYKRFE